MQASGGNPFATAFPKRESEDALLFENRLKNFGMKSEGFNNMSNIFDDFQFSSGGHSVGASLLVKRPDDLSSKGMMSKLSGSDSATVISSIPSSSDSKAASERISLASSSPSRTQARALLFPQEQYIKSEKAKFLPPRQTLLSSLPNPVVAPEKRDFERKKLLPTRYDEQIHDIQEDFHEIIGEDDYWTTVFGFPPGEVSQVIAYFQRLGPLDEVRTVNSNRSQSGDSLPAGPTWIHLRWQNRLDAEKALRRQGTILRAYTESTGQGQKQLQRHDQGRLFDVKDGGTPLESLAMDYMVGVMRYSKAKQVLGTQNETIYWQSPIRKKNIVLDKKNYRDKERPTALSNIPRTSSLSNGPRVPVDEQSHPAFSIFQAPAESTLRENGNYSILDRVLDILF